MSEGLVLISGRTAEFELTPRRLLRILLTVLAFIFVMHGLALITVHVLGFHVARGFVPVFHMDAERNVPTFAAGLLLLACSIISGVMAVLEGNGRHRRAWTLVAFAFLFISADEVFQLHETFGQYLYAEFTDAGLPLFAWIVPYGIGVAVFGAVLLRWFFELEGRFQRSLFFAAALFLTGALGFEWLGSNHYETQDIDRPDFRTLIGDMLATFEETLEFVGASLFLYTMLSRLGGIRFGLMGALPGSAHLH